MRFCVLQLELLSAIQKKATVLAWATIILHHVVDILIHNRFAGVASKIVGEPRDWKKKTSEVVGIALISLNIVVIVVTVVSISLDSVAIVKHLKQIERDARKSKTQIEPLGDGEKKSLREYTSRIIEGSKPVAIKNMGQFTRSTFGASSEEYKSMLQLLSDLQKDRIRDKRSCCEKSKKSLNVQTTKIA